MFQENLTTAEAKPDKELTPEELGHLTIDEVFTALNIQEPAAAEITNLAGYMAVQKEVMQKLIQNFHDENAAIDFFQNHLAEEFKNKYRQNF